MIVTAASDACALRELLDSGWNAPEPLVDEVREIVVAVRERGDAALVEYARRHDDQGFELSKLRVPIPMLESARSLVQPEVAAALEKARERLSRFHQRQRQPDLAYVEEDGSRYAVHRRPLHSAAVYAQRSGAAWAVLMGALPAKIAGVSRVIALSPPVAGAISPAVLFACALCGVDELYAVGGAQAIAGAAFGTDSMAPVDKIVGRGGPWTTEAKRCVLGRCGIDGLAGPPELLVVADEGASSEYVVGELLAQAERPRVTRLAVLSESRPLLEAVSQLADTLDAESLGERCVLIEAASRDELFEVLNRFAPAVLSLQVRDASSYMDRIQAAGTVFVGDTTPLVSGEYLAGINRVVPTSGTARFASALSLGDFARSFSVVENSADRMAADAAALETLAESDGLPNHAQTARMRSDT